MSQTTPDPASKALQALSPSAAQLATVPEKPACTSNRSDEQVQPSSSSSSKQQRTPRQEGPPSIAKIRAPQDLASALEEFQNADSQWLAGCLYRLLPAWGTFEA